MPEKTIESRLDAVEQLFAQASAALVHLRSDVEIGTRIETANVRDIEKLKRHVAKLQHPETPETIPAHDTHEDGL